MQARPAGIRRGIGRGIRHGGGRITRRGIRRITRTRAMQSPTATTSSLTATTLAALVAIAVNATGVSAPAQYSPRDDALLRAFHAQRLAGF